MTKDANLPSDERDLTGSLRLHHLVEQQVDRSPDAVALELEGRTWTYRELDTRANRLANHLISLGVGPDVHVGLFVERSMELVLGIFAILKAGAAYVPLEPDLPNERLAGMLEDVRPAVILTQSALSARLPPTSARVVALDGDSPSTRQASTDRPKVALEATHAAYVIFTSGSTGRPKGTVIPHRAIVAFMTWLRREFRLGPEDAWLQKIPFSFDPSVYEIHAPLISGGRLVITKPGGQREPAYLARLIHDARVTHLASVPSVVSALLDEERFDDIGSMRCVFCGGEPLTPALVERFQKRTKSALVNLYGPTETTIASTWWRCPDAPSRVSIGEPIAGTVAFVLNDGMKMAVAGAPGELYIGGDGLARGYLARPDLTAERFVPNPFSDEPGARLYRTGDLARAGADGNLEILGRVDEQIKLRGFRIELGEVTAATRACAGVRDALVVARGNDGEKRLVAYLIPDGTLDVPAIQAALARTLPEYMIPYAFVPIDAWPLTPNGKVDRKALPAPSADSNQRPYTAPRNPIEEVCAGLFAAILNVPRVGVDDDFIALGGDSLSAIKLVSRIRASLSVDLSAVQVLELRTVGALAAEIDQARPQERAAPLVRSTDRQRPLSPGERRLWLVHQMARDTGAYAARCAFWIAGRFDPELLARAVAAVIERHDILRTTYALSGNVPIASVSEARAAPLEVVRVENEAEGITRANDEARRPFDLDRGPLTRPTLFVCAQGRSLLSFAFHHIVFDGVSAKVLLDELSATYSSLFERRPAEALASPQYGDYAIWRAGEAGSADTDLAYWSKELEGAPPALMLPPDRPRPAVQSFVGDHVPVDFGPQLVARIDDLAAELGATRFMVTLAAWALLLGRHACQRDVVVGCPVAGRHHPAVEQMVGFFVQTLPLRIKWQPTTSFRDLVGQARERTLHGLRHEDLPLERLVDAIAGARDPSRNPLFQAMLVFQTPLPQARVGDAVAEAAEDEPLGAQVDAMLSLTPTAQRGLRGYLSFGTAIFDRATALRWVERLEVLLRAAVDSPASSVESLSLLASSDHAVLEKLVPAPVRSPTGTLHDRFAAQVARSPHAVAVRAGTTTLTYRDLDRRSNQLASELVASGVAREEGVGVFLERSPELIIAVLGIAKAGAAVVPIDPTYPKERLRHMLREGGVRWIVSQRSLAGGMEGAKSVLVDPDAPAWSRPGDAVPPVPTSASQLLYVIFTSGSTGTPKGVAVTHECITNLIDWQIAERRSTALRTLQFTSLSFDVSFQEIALTLMTGGELEIVDEETRRDGTRLLEYVERKRIGRMFMPFVALETVAQASRGHGFESVREIITAGEALRITPALEDVLGRSDGVSLDNQYGPSETHVATAHLLEGDVRSWPRLPPIGLPVQNMRAYVLDEQMRRVPPGVVGEIYLAGVGLARGYSRRPDLTADRFVPDPWAAPGDRMYRTGDLGRQQNDGLLEYVGRNDDQVKISGARVELGEIEAALSQHPAVKAAAIGVHTTAAGTKRLVGYVVPSAEAPTANDLRHMLEARLPRYMVPAAFVVLRALPLTASGKVDRRALPPPDADAFDASEYAAPVTANEAVLCELFATVLGAPRVGRHDDFFALGGNSLLAVQLIAAIRSRLSVVVSMRALHECSTVAELAKRLEAARKPEALVPPVTAAPRPERVPASYGQERLWFLEQLAPGVYHLGIAVRLKGRLDVPALRASLEEVVRRHEVLRTTFVLAEGDLLQRAAPEPRIDWEDVRVGDEKGPARQWMPWLTREFQRAFDLEKGPLVRVRVLELRPDEHVLAVVMHHAVVDGWSCDVLLRELSALYPALLEGRPSPLRPLPVQYADFAMWQRRWLDPSRQAGQLAYWKAKLEALPALALATDHPRGASTTRGGARHRFTISPELTAALRALVRQGNLATSVPFLTAFHVLLERYSGQLDFGIGLAIPDRSTPELEALIGFFVNTLVFRADLSGRPTVAELLKRVHDGLLDVYANKDIPLDVLANELKVERSPDRSPFIDVVFQFDSRAPASKLGTLDVESVELDEGVAAFDLTLVVTERAETAAVTIEYRTDLFERSTIERMAQSYVTILENMARDAGQRADRIVALDDPATAELLALGSGGEGDPGAPIHELFRRRAAAISSTTSLVFSRGRLSYGELDEASDRLAQRLVAQGIRVGDVVAVMIDRSADTATAILGAMKAGAVYMPLDHQLPKNRIRRMLEISRAVAVLAWSSHADVASQLAEGIPIVLVDRVPASTKAPLALPRVPADALAYVVFTSGSTGEPKGVLVAHRGFESVARAHRESSGIVDGTRSMQFASYTFDSHVLDLLGGLLAGASNYICSEDDRSDPEAFAAAHAIEVTMLTPALLATLQPGKVPALRAIVTAGEAATERVRALWSDRVLVNQYGPTEFTVCATLGRLTERGNPASIGRPLPGVRAYIVDGDCRLAPRGAYGELCLAGPQLAVGYIGRGDLTADRFVPDPFSREPGARMYRTGDLARWLPTGEIEFVGRVDSQVKLRGFRIELAEIESALLKHPEVSASAVVLREDSPGDKRLVAYLVPVRRESHPTTADLERALSTWLPKYMVPSAFVWLDQLPLNAHRKLDRAALPAPEVVVAPRAEPRTDTEKGLARTFAELLGVPPVGLHDDFFALGGHSLLVMRLIARVRDEMGAKLLVRDVFECPTVEALARRVRHESVPRTFGGPRPSVLPLSPAQQRFWFLEQMSPGLYHAGVVVRLRGSLDLGALRRALQAVVSRHEALRTSFALDEDGRPCQVVAPSLEPPFELVTLPASTEGGDGALDRWVGAEIQRPFDLESVPLFRFTVVELGLHDHVLVMPIHHILTDGESCDLLLRDLAAFYRGFLAGEPVALPPLTLHYADFAIERQREVADDAMKTDVAFWTKKLANLPVLELPTDRPRSPTPSLDARAHSFTLPASLRERAVAFAREEGATPFMLYLTAFEVTLRQLSGQSDFALGTATTDRPYAAFENVVGCFVNNPVIRVDLARNPTGREALRRTRDTVVDAQDRQNAPLDVVVRELGLRRAPGRSPIFEVFFLVDTPAALPSFGDVEARRFDVSNDTAAFDIVLHLVDAPGKLEASLLYRTALFDATTAERMADRFRRVLSALLDDPDRHLDEYET